MDISKISASLLAQSAEANFGLATLNLDFSIMKFEAPKEYEPLGGELSHSRRRAAEDERPHFTARKLGALFQDWIPHTPQLIRAFGRRAVEIATSRKVNPKATKSDGIFSEYIGIDGTGIWAAATSGPHVIPIYLLACILARMWSPSEATAIWDQLVNERKKELSVVEDIDPLYEKAQHLSRLSIARDDLARWDSSARAWVQSADQVMAAKHKQLMLIVDNLELPVNTKPNLFGNVKETWKSAMVVVDSLIGGAPQSIRDGAVLLGLSSWHIFPDMIILGTGSAAKEIRQNDHLVNPAGTLTLGLQIANPRNQGVYWSLSLSHLRYYGGPVMAERSLTIQGNRVTVPEFIQVSMGSLTRRWKMEKRFLADITSRLWHYIERESSSHCQPGCRYWFSYLSGALEPLLEDDEEATAQCKRLIGYGERRCPNFLLPPTLRVQPLSGMLNLHTFLNLLKENEDGVYALRLVAEKLRLRMDSVFLIRYSVGSGDAQKYSLQYEYATALPVSWVSLKRDAHGDTIHTMAHARWVNTIFFNNDGTSYYDSSRLDRFRSMGENVFPLESFSVVDQGRSFIWYDAPKLLNAGAKNTLYEEEPKTDEVTAILAENQSKDIELNFIAGDNLSIGLYATTKALEKDHQPIPSHISIETLMKCLGDNTVSSQRLLKFLNSVIRREDRVELLQSFRALATVESIYRMLPDSTVSLEVTTNPLYDMKWVPDRRFAKDILPSFRFSPFDLDIGGAFSLVTLLESGSIAIPPDSLGKIMAMATGDSIYIAAALLCDPSEACHATEIRRVRGNIGRPGMAMLIPPQQPQIRDIESDWRLVSHNPFDGQLEDSLSKTSLHLHFTDCIFPIDIGTHGNKDYEVYFLESVVSVFDAGKWVGDLDILGQLSGAMVYRLEQECTHQNLECEIKELVDSSGLTMTDNWDEVLEQPETAAMVRSQANDIGRLATAVMCAQLNRPTIVLPNRCCWACIKHVWASSGNSGMSKHRVRDESTIWSNGGQVSSARGKDPLPNITAEDPMLQSSDCVDWTDIFLANHETELEKFLPVHGDSDGHNDFAEGHWDPEVEWIFDGQEMTEEPDDQHQNDRPLGGADAILDEMKGYTFIC